MMKEPPKKIFLSIKMSISGIGLLSPIIIYNKNIMCFFHAPYDRNGMFFPNHIAAPKWV